MIWFFILIFAVSCILLYFSGELVVGGLMKIAKFFAWREFVVAFFVMAFAASLPNLFVGITSALKGVPQLSFGDVAGNNLIAMTLVVAFGVFLLKIEKFQPKAERCKQLQFYDSRRYFTIIADWRRRAFKTRRIVIDSILCFVCLLAFFQKRKIYQNLRYQPNSTNPSRERIKNLF